jgi:myo-inositol 2-dehydrogenase/D-chiro-inositol 1-dehydrogenase
MSTILAGNAMSELRIAVLGVGVMGADHVARITSRISGAHVAVVNDFLTEKAEQIAASVPGARVAGDPLDAIAADDVDAVLLATPGPTHEKQLLACLEHRKPVLCEKPLTTDAGTSLEVVRREAEFGTPLIQVGFMRRFDPEYARLKAVIDGGEVSVRRGDRVGTDHQAGTQSRCTRWPAGPADRDLPND